MQKVAKAMALMVALFHWLIGTLLSNELSLEDDDEVSPARSPVMARGKADEV